MADHEMYSNTPQFGAVGSPSPQMAWGASPMNPSPPNVGSQSAQSVQGQGSQGPQGSPQASPQGSQMNAQSIRMRRYRGDIGSMPNVSFDRDFGTGTQLDDLEMGSATGTQSDNRAGAAMSDRLLLEAKAKFRKFIMDFNPQQEDESAPQLESHYMELLKRTWATCPGVGSTEDGGDSYEGVAVQFPVDCVHLASYDKKLYMQLTENPTDIIAVFDRELWELSCSLPMFKDEISQHEHLNIRVKTYNLLPQDTRKMRDMEPEDIEKLVSMTGIVIRCSDLIPDMLYAAFYCSTADCNETQNISLIKHRIFEPQRCDNCGMANSFILRHNACDFGNKQYIKLQETPESIPPGETPQTIQLYCFDELYDTMKPGDRVEVCGILRAASQRLTFNQRTQRSVYRTYLDCISVRKEFDVEKNTAAMLEEAMKPLSDMYDCDPDLVGEEDAEINRKIRALAAETDKDNNLTIRQKLVESIAPSIHELEHVKKGLLCQLFEGTAKTMLNKSSQKTNKLREQIHILLCGDPSTAKSQLMTAVNKLATRGVITSGKGSSAVGLTAYITKDPETKDIILESGALVLSDRGVCCIDEFDKMGDDTRAVLNEAMEQQTVSVAKAGIVCSLNAKASILATANPVGSRYDPSKTIMENINLPATLTSRFDLVYLMLDRQDAKADQLLARHIVSMFSQSGRQSEKEPPLSRTLFRRYVDFAKKRCRPRLTEEASNLLVSKYMAMRSGQLHDGAVCAVPRTLESLIRLSESFAKMELRETVTNTDIEDAYELLNEATFKSAVDPVTGKIDMQSLRTGVSIRERQTMEMGSKLLKDLLKESNAAIALRDAQNAVNELLQQKKLSILRMKSWKEVIEQMVRNGDCLQRGEMLSLP